MNFAASIHAKLIPENIITEIRWVAWSDTGELSGIVQLDPANPANFVPIERVTPQLVMDWARQKLDMEQI